jgi:hypothetical protein
MKTLSLGAVVLCIAGTTGCMNASASAGDHHAMAIGGDMNRTLDQDDSLSLIGGNMDLGGRVGGDVSLVGGNIELDLDIGRDLSVAGGNLDVRGRIGEDASIAGGAIDWHADVGHDLELAGGDVTIDAEIGNDLEVASGELTIANDTVIRRNAEMAAGQIEMNGRIGGTLDAAAAFVQVRGTVDGFTVIEADPREGRRSWHASFDQDGNRSGSTNGLVEITGTLNEGADICARRVSVLRNARIFGELRVWADFEPNIADGASIGSMRYEARDGRDCDDILDDNRAR